MDRSKLKKSLVCGMVVLLAVSLWCLAPADVFADVVIDNRDTVRTSHTGTWEVSGATNPYGADSVWSRDGSTFTWHFDSIENSQYELLMWWTEWPSRSTSVPVDIVHADGATRVYINQSVNGGQWNSLGEYAFESGQSYRVTITAQPGPSSTCADAVRFLPVSAAPADVIIDNRNLSKTSQTGVWGVSSAPNHYDVDSVWSRDGTTFTWHFDPARTSQYELMMWWTEWPSRSNSVPVQIEHAEGISQVIVDQTLNGGQWNSLGAYHFEFGQSYRVTIIAQPGPSSTSADAVRFMSTDGGTPTANFSATPVSGSAPLAVEFTDASAGSVTGWTWNFGDGQSSTSQHPTHTYVEAGVYTVKLTITGPGGNDETIKESYITVTASATHDVIIDNRDPETSQTGSWGVSGAPNPYGVDSVWGRDGPTFTWHFEPPQTGQYEVMMWWTEWSSRSTSIPVDIEYAGGTAQVIINQQSNGGKWNRLGDYPFSVGHSYSVTITGQPGPSSTCADAVRFISIDGGTPTANFSATPVSGPAPLAVQFTDASTGSVTAWAWNFGDGQSSTKQHPTHTYTEAGVYTVKLTITGPGGDDETIKESYITVTAATANGTEHIYAGFLFAYNDRGEPTFLNTLQSVGAWQDGDVWRYTNAALNKDYVIHIIRDNEALEQALKTQGAHILLSGHANYGLGAVFATDEENRTQRIWDILYIDDDRIFNNSSRMIHPALRSVRNSHSFPFFWPIYKDGTNGIMPYELSDPKGSPPYNYHLSYQVPGNQTYYRLDSPKNSPIQRFPGIGATAWFSSDGSAPDPSNPNHSNYFITNSAAWYPSAVSRGNWVQSRSPWGYFGENYVYAPAGHGDSVFEWFFEVPQPGDYTVYARWPNPQNRTSDAPYTVNHSSGTTLVSVNQNTGARQWNQVGEFYFAPAQGSIVQTNDTSSGIVIADAVRIAHTDNPPLTVQADFRANSFSGSAPLTVRFTDQSTGMTEGDITARRIYFGDGASSGLFNTTNTYTYTTPGIYTVSLEVSGPSGSSVKTRPGYIRVDQSAVQQTEFRTTAGHTYTHPATVSFRNASSSVGTTTTRLWNFGDGGTSTASDPSYTYSEPGLYTVSLTINGVTETKENFIRVVVSDKIIDNVDYPKTHAGSRTFISKKVPPIPREELKYSRMLYASCSSGPYYAEAFGHGIMFYTLSSGSTYPINIYIRNYLEGKSDEEIWRALQNYEPIWDYYDFNKYPWEQ